LTKPSSRTTSPEGPRQGGTQANFTGANLQRFVEDWLERCGYVRVDKAKFGAACYLEQPAFTRQAHIGQSIYGTNLYCDFMLYHPAKHPHCLIIEVKWQQVGGSVDEKYPYLMSNIKERYPCRTVLVLDGKGYKKGAEEWIRRQVDDKLIAVLDMPGFMSWVNTGAI
jgi:hypothetical protein